MIIEFCLHSGLFLGIIDGGTVRLFLSLLLYFTLAVLWVLLVGYFGWIQSALAIWIVFGVIGLGISPAILLTANSYYNCYYLE